MQQTHCIYPYNNEKVFIMTYRTLFFQLLMTLLCATCPINVIAGGLPPHMQMDIEKELAEANKAIEEYVSSLPAAEQAEFNRAVEEMSQMFENMSDKSNRHPPCTLHTACWARTRFLRETNAPHQGQAHRTPHPLKSGCRVEY